MVVSTSLVRNMKVRKKNKRPHKRQQVILSGKPETSWADLELEKCTRENKLSTNQLEQYNRSSFILEISLMTRQDVIELLKIVASNADIKGFEENQVDVAHRTSRRKTAPIIVKFVKKNDGINFYHQRKKGYDLKENQIVSSVDFTKDDEEVTINNIV